MSHCKRVGDVDGMYRVTLTIVTRSVNPNDDALRDRKALIIEDMKRVHRLEW